MNKSASELIALDKAGLDAAVRECARITAPEISDEEYEKIVAEDSLRYRNTRLDMERTILAYLSAANQSGSERAGVDALREALEECISVLSLSERPAFVDPEHGVAVRELGDRIGYGALMSSAQAIWRQRLAEDGDPVGGEFVAGPCYSTILAVLKTARAALATPPAQPAPNPFNVSELWDMKTHGKPDGAVREAVRFVLHNDERERDYPIYETDDDRGLDECEYINFATDVIAALRSPKIAAAETSPGDVLAMKEAWRKFSGLMLVDGDPPSIVYPAEVDQNEWASAYDGLCAAIDRLDVKAEAKSQEPEACK